VRSSPASWLSLAISGAGDFQVARSLVGLSHAEGTMSSILVVEDQYFLAMDSVLEVERRGLKALVAGTLNDALEMAQTADLCGAVIDIDLHGERAFSVIDLLRERTIPVLICTGYSADVLPKRLSSVPLLQKPCLPAEVLDTLMSLMQNGNGA
jgi:ActR/RegA family two-component response regulator